jgi:hypothetical protein
VTGSSCRVAAAVFGISALVSAACSFAHPMIIDITTAKAIANITNLYFPDNTFHLPFGFLFGKSYPKPIVGDKFAEGH